MGILLSSNIKVPTLNHNIHVALGDRAILIKEDVMKTMSLMKEVSTSRHPIAFIRYLSLFTHFIISEISFYSLFSISFLFHSIYLDLAIYVPDLSYKY